MRTMFLLRVFSGCTSLAVVDLKGDEAKEAASELATYACGKYSLA